LEHNGTVLTKIDRSAADQHSPARLECLDAIGLPDPAKGSRQRPPRAIIPRTPESAGGAAVGSKSTLSGGQYHSTGNLVHPLRAAGGSHSQDVQTMKVLFLDDVSGVALGGEIKEVKNGFARNYLIPKRLAVPATKDALQRVQRLSRDAEQKRLKQLANMRALGEALDGTRVEIEMRAGANGRLYGSVTNAVVAAELSKITAREIDRRTIEVPDSIREVGMHSATVRVHSEVTATLALVVYPAGTDPEEFVQELEEAAQVAESEAESADTESEGQAAE
jgi:large subunit ribosomal protein L9